MQHHTGSVYLDAPTRVSRKPVVSSSDRRRSVLAAICVGIGITALTLSSLAAGLRSLVLDPDQAMSAFDEALDDPAVTAELEREIASGIETALIGPELVDVAAAFDLDVAAEATRIAPAILEDPVVRSELRVLVGDLHSRVVLESDAAVLTLGPITTAVINVIEREAPLLAGIIPAETTLWTISGDTLPDLSFATDTLNRVTVFSLLPVLLIPLGFAVHPHRHRVTAWIGRWALASALLCGLAAVGLSYLGGALTGLSAVEIAIRAVSLKLVAPAVIAGITGMGLVSFATILRKREKRRVADEGAAAALGYDEPPMWQQTSGPAAALPARALIDVNHPLTNI